MKKQMYPKQIHLPKEDNILETISIHIQKSMTKKAKYLLTE